MYFTSEFVDIHCLAFVQWEGWIWARCIDDYSKCAGINENQSADIKISIETKSFGKQISLREWEEAEKKIKTLDEAKFLRVDIASVYSKSS